MSLVCQIKILVSFKALYFDATDGTPVPHKRSNFRTSRLIGEPSFHPSRGKHSNHNGVFRRNASSIHNVTFTIIFEPVALCRAVFTFPILHFLNRTMPVRNFPLKYENAFCDIIWKYLWTFCVIYFLYFLDYLSEKSATIEL